MTLAIVTDSTAYPPAGFLPDGVRVVPLRVTAVSAWWEDELSPGELIELLDSDDKVTTSGATPAQFASVYRELRDEGFDEVLSIHLSGELSGTVRAAEVAAGISEAAVMVVDSRSCAMGLGFAAHDAALAAADGADAAEAARVAGLVVDDADVGFLVDNLAHLHRGGRIGSAAAMTGQLLGVKPLLVMRDGRIHAGERVRTAARARARIVDRIAARVEAGPVRVALHHLGAPEAVEAMRAEVAERTGLIAEQILISEVGAVVGAHTGPGLLGAVVVPG